MALLRSSVCVLLTALAWSQVDHGARAEALPFPLAITLEGRLAHEQYEELLERPFEVPPGTRRITIDLRYTGQERRTVIDLGLRGPTGLRGWSGGSRRQIEVSALTASPGYLSGPVEPGTWAVLLGVPNVRAGSDDTYTLSIHLFDDDRAVSDTVVNPAPGWYVGDLHAHSMHSDGRARALSGRQTPTPPHRVFEAAAAAGLDFVALTDHNTVSHWLDVDRLQPYFDRVLLLHGREVTTYRGHANTIGERRFADFRLEHPTASPASLLRGIAADGAFIALNHPTLPDDESCMGCGWNVTDDDVMASVRGVEVLNGDVGPGVPPGWTFWASLLNRGFRLTAVGGSDEHTVDDPRDRTLGAPATVVFAPELSEAGLIQGLLSGRVYVRTKGPSGPTADFWADAEGQRYEMGEVMRAPADATLTLHADVRGAAGQTIEWIHNGEVSRTDRVEDRPLSQRVTARAGDWYAIRLAKGPVRTILSNAVYVARSAATAPR